MLNESWADHYDFVYEEMYKSQYNSFTQLSLDLISSYLQKGSIIDFGAGTGRLAIPLSKMGFEVTAVDISPSMCAVLKKKAENHNLRNFTIVNRDFSTMAKAEYHLGICLFTVINYLTSTQQLEESLLSFVRCLKKDAFLILDLAGNDLFECRGIMNYNTRILKRKVTITPTSEKDVYQYLEQGSGKKNGIVFEYTDEGLMRHWQSETIISFLKHAGMALCSETLEQFKNTGSEYLVFRKEII